MLDKCCDRQCPQSEKGNQSDLVVWQSALVAECCEDLYTTSDGECSRHQAADVSRWQQEQLVRRYRELETIGKLNIHFYGFLQGEYARYPKMRNCQTRKVQKHLISINPVCEFKKIYFQASQLLVYKVKQQVTGSNLGV